MRDKNKIAFDYQYKYTWQVINKMYTEQAQKYNSSMSIGFVLISIDYKNGTPSTLLGPKVGIEANSLSRSLNKMEGEGLIYREKNPDDGRSVLIKLTEKGKEEREIAKQIVIKFNKTIQHNLTHQEIESFLKVTQKIHHLIETKSIF